MIHAAPNEHGKVGLDGRNAVFEGAGYNRTILGGTDKRAGDESRTWHRSTLTLGKNAYLPNAEKDTLSSGPHERKGIKMPGHVNQKLALEARGRGNNRDLLYTRPRACPHRLSRQRRISMRHCPGYGVLPPTMRFFSTHSSSGVCRTPTDAFELPSGDISWRIQSRQAILSRRTLALLRGLSPGPVVRAGHSTNRGPAPVQDRSCYLSIQEGEGSSPRDRRTNGTTLSLVRLRYAAH